MQRRASYASFSFIMAGLALILPYLIEIFARPALNQTYPPHWAIFCVYGLPWILWLIILPGFALIGFVQLMRGRSERATCDLTSQPPSPDALSQDAKAAMHLMGVMNLVFGIPRVAFGVYLSTVVMGYTKFNTPDRSSSIVLGASVEAIYPWIWIIVGIGAIRGCTWSRWCSVWLTAPTLLTLLVYVWIPCLQFLSRHPNDLTAGGCLITLMITLFFAFKYIQISLRSACCRSG